MAAYAALVSLLNNLEQIKNHPSFFASLDKHQIESLGEKIDFFLDFVENYSSNEDLETQIACAVHEAGDVVESHIVDQILPPSTSTELVSSHHGCLFSLKKVIRVISAVRSHHHHHGCLLGLKKVMQDMDSVKIKVIKVKKEWESNHHHHPMPPAAAASSSKPLITIGKSSMVGFDDESMQLKELLTAQRSSLQIVSIVGMGGIGKTTLARNVYESSLIREHFDICAWVTISQEYNVMEIISQILSFQGIIFINEELHVLGERLYKSLCGRRYLIVLDDVWSDSVWDNIKRFFPDNSNRSRVVLTTRLSDVATHMHHFCIRINFLDEDKSWDLFCRQVFGEEDCHDPELEGIGKTIVNKCRGLPLSIVVIGGLLRSSHRTKEHWQNILENINNSILNSKENGQCWDVLHLSYSHLPAYLKPCFLYMGTYREDSEIRVSKMIKLWVAEGFLKPNGVQKLEEIAEDYLNDLVGRNLVLVCSYASNGKIKSCRLHDLLRELSLILAKKEKYFHVWGVNSIPRDIYRERRLICHQSVEVSDSLSAARSLICEGAVGALKYCRLLRVLSWCADDVSEADFQNINLRYFDLMPPSFPSSVSLIWNLQTLIIGSEFECVVAPSEIWKMRQLRHLKGSYFFIPDPPDDDDSVVLWNLQTLKKVVNFRLSKEVCNRIPNIKKLCLVVGDIWNGYDDCLFDNLQNLGSLHNLESLTILWNISWLMSFSTKWRYLSNAFPTWLKKLSIGGRAIHFEHVSNTVASLPRLEVLKLTRLSGDLCCVEGGFLCLKFMQLHLCALKSWTLETYSCFPALNRLVLRDLSSLVEIPSEFGGISTIQLISLNNCTESAMISAMKIKEEQESYGNDDLQIHVTTAHRNSEIRFRKRVEIEGLSVDDIHFQSGWDTDSDWTVSTSSYDD